MNFNTSILISLSNPNSALYNIVSYTIKMLMSVSSWLTKPMMFLNSASVTSLPLTRAIPLTLSLLHLRASRLRNVDLPAPNAPMIAMTFPGLIEPEMSRIVQLPRVYVIEEKWSEAGMWSVMSLEASFSSRRMWAKSLPFPVWSACQKTREIH